MSNNEVALFGGQTLPTEIPSYAAADAGKGNENVSAADQQIPQLKVLNPLSPEVESGIASAGKLFNTMTEEGLDVCYVVNLRFEKSYAIFKKREMGGGWAGNFDTLPEAQKQVSELPGGDVTYDIIETAKHTCLLLNPETGEIDTPIHIYLKSTGLNVSRNWNSQIAIHTASTARYAAVWKITADKRQSNGNTWFVPKVEFVSYLPEAQYKEAGHQFTELTRLDA